MSIEKIIGMYLERKRKEEISPSKFRVSDAGRCRLMRYWKRQGIPYTNKPDDRTLRVFEAGNVFHHWLQSILKEEGILIEKEKEVEDEHRIGHVDAVIRSEEGFILYDFKTIHSKKFHYNYTEDIHYFLQLWTYASMLPYGVEDARIVYISKDDLCIREISAACIPNIEEVTALDWHYLIEAWETKKEPKPNPLKWECKFCLYRTKCQWICEGGKSETV